MTSLGQHIVDASVPNEKLDEHRHHHHMFIVSARLNNSSFLMGGRIFWLFFLAQSPLILVKIVFGKGHLRSFYSVEGIPMQNNNVYPYL